jgi:hypothetical protein
MPNSDLPLSTTRELLASLHMDRARTLEALRGAPFQITSDALSPRRFWQLFDDSVRSDGTFDANAFLGPSRDDVEALTDPISVAIGVMALCVTAFAVGYAIGKDVADNEDNDEAADDNESSNQGDDTHDNSSGEQSTITFAPSPRGIAVRVSTTTTPHSKDISVQELLTMLKKDRSSTLRRLRTQSDWRVVMDSIQTKEIWSFIDSSVRLDGTIELGSLEPAAVNRVALAAPVFADSLIIVVIAVLALASGALGYGVGYHVNKDTKHIDDAPSSEPTDESSTGDGSDTPGDSGTPDGENDSGNDSDPGGAGAGITGTPVLQLSELGTLNLTVYLAPVEERLT